MTFALTAPRVTAKSLYGEALARAERLIIANHYLRSIPAGKSWWYAFEDCIVVYAISANKNLARSVLGFDGSVVELARLWAPDGHRGNLLTEAISKSVGWLRQEVRDLDALVSFADPNVGHHGGVYRAASWMAAGRSEETRGYVKDGKWKSRRAFHSGSRGLTKAEIEARGWNEENKPGKLRFIKPISNRAKRAVCVTIQ